jgi:hypothetical protein
MQYTAAVDLADLDLEPMVLMAVVTRPQDTIEYVKTKGQQHIILTAKPLFLSI